MKQQINKFIMASPLNSLYCLFFWIFTWGAAFSIYASNSYLSIKTILSYSLPCIILIFLVCQIVKYAIGAPYGQLFIFFTFLLLGIILRVTFNIVVDPKPVSDFLVPTDFYIYLSEHGSYSQYCDVLKDLDSYQRYYARYPAWGSYMLIVKLIYDLWGVDIFYLFFLNLILFVLSAVFIYKSFQADKVVALLAIFIISTNPTAIIWCSEHTPDHITIFLISVLIFFASKYYDETSKKKIWCCVGIAITCALINLFKPLYILFILVVFVTDILRHALKIKVMTKEYVKQGIVIMGTFVLTSIILSALLVNNIEHIIKTKVEQSSGLYWLCAYSVDDTGHWDNSIGGEIFFETISESETLSEANHRLDKRVREMIGSNYMLIPRIIIEKYRALYLSETYSWALVSMDIGVDSETFKKNINSIVHPLTVGLGIFTMLILPFSLCKIETKRIFISLGYIGYMSVLIIAAPQSRYKYIGILFQSILTAMVVSDLIQYFDKLLVNNKEKYESFKK